MRALPFPWLDIISYRVFGVRIGGSVVAYEGYIDPEFVEMGDNTMTSLHICIFSHLLYHDKIIIKKVKVGKNCVVGPQSIIFPGTIMYDGAILGANSYTSIGQELKGDLIHIGRPVNKEFTVQSVEESQVKAEKVKKFTGEELEGGDN
jgi:carbonic anhydrase/acetyltransferase-like protein (isoleucine patch superfamily)